MKNTLIGLVILLFTSVSHAASFVAVSDIHFNPYYACSKNVMPCPLVVKLRDTDSTQWEAVLQQYDAQKLAAYDDDTNYGLLQSALSALKITSKQISPKFVVILGDFLAHNYQENYHFYSGDPTQLGYQQFVKKTLQFLTAEINKTFPEIPVYPVVGNADSYGKDYAMLPQGLFFKEVAQLWKPLLHNQRSEKYFAQVFPVSGYYTVEPSPVKGMRIIVLDSVLFSPYAQSSDVEQAANQQLDWLAEQLKIAANKNQKVWFFMHIPVGIDAYKTARYPLHFIYEFWMPVYANKFLKLLDQYSPVIVGMFTGHTHMDGFVLLGKNHQLSDSFVPAISPVFGNNSAFKIYRYDEKTFQTQDFIKYILPLSAQKNNWDQEYDFNQVYQPGCKNCTLINGMKKIVKSGPLAMAYQDYYAAGHASQPITNGKWVPYYWCAIWNVTRQDYEACLKSS